MTQVPLIWEDGCRYMGVHRYGAKTNQQCELQGGQVLGLGPFTDYLEEDMYDGRPGVRLCLADGEYTRPFFRGMFAEYADSEEMAVQ